MGSGGRVLIAAARKRGYMAIDEIQDRVLAVFKKNRRVGAAPLDLNTTFDELRLDSLEVFCIVFDLEDEFNITIPDNAAQNMRCIGDVVGGVRTVLREGSPDSLVQQRQAQ